MWFGWAVTLKSSQYRIIIKGIVHEFVEFDSTENNLELQIMG